MLTSKVVPLGLVAVLLAGCAETTPMSPELKRALTAPSNAVECRMVYRKTEKDQRAAMASSTVGITSGAGLLGAAIGRGIAGGINESRRKRDLAACYNSVGAPITERLPMDGPNRASVEADEAAFAGTASAPVQTAAPNPLRQGPGGGAGFSTF